jgi:hypothetical protein
MNYVRAVLRRLTTPRLPPYRRPPTVKPPAAEGVAIIRKRRAMQTDKPEGGKHEPET